MQGMGISTTMKELSVLQDHRPVREWYSQRANPTAGRDSAKEARKPAEATGSSCWAVCTDAVALLLAQLCELGRVVVVCKLLCRVDLNRYVMLRLFHYRQRRSKRVAV